MSYCFCKFVNKHVISGAYISKSNEWCDNAKPHIIFMTKISLDFDIWILPTECYRQQTHFIVFSENICFIVAKLFLFLHKLHFTILLLKYLARKKYSIEWKICFHFHLCYHNRTEAEAATRGVL